MIFQKLYEFGTYGSVEKYYGSESVITLPRWDYGGDLVTTVGEEVFSGNETLEVLIVPEDHVTFYRNAFRGCKRLREVRFGTSMRYIKEGAFENCVSLETINLSAGMQIEPRAFRNCRGLADENGFICLRSDNQCILLDYCGDQAHVKIPEYITGINTGAFLENDTLEEVIFPESVSYIPGWRGFENCRNLRKVTLPGNLTQIPPSMFLGCTALQEIDLPESVTEIGRSAFCGCAELKKIRFPSGLQTIHMGAFNGCTQLLQGDGDFLCINGILMKYRGSGGDVVIPHGIGAIGPGVFYNNPTITSVFLPGSVRSVGEEAFYRCENLSEVTLSEGLEVLERGAFAYTPIEEIQLPESLKIIEHLAFNTCAKLRRIHMPETLESIGGSCFDRCTHLEALTIPRGIKELPTAVCENCVRLQQVALPDTLCCIAQKAFADCPQLKQVVFPPSLVSIGEEAFLNCSSLHVTFQSRPFIGKQAFQGCEAAYIEMDGLLIMGTTVVGYCGEGGAVKIPEGITAIDADAFSDYGKRRDMARTHQKITSVTLPKSLISLGDRAFSGCKLLEEVVFLGDDCTIGRSAFSCCPRLRSVILPPELYIIRESTFAYCGSLRTITLPEQLGCINSYAFSETPLEMVEFPDTLEEIGEEAFCGCALTDVKLPRRMEILGDMAFRGNPLEEAWVPEHLIRDYGTRVIGDIGTFEEVSNDPFPENTQIFAMPSYSDDEDLEDIDWDEDA